MVSIIENWASIQGIVQSVGDSADLKGYWQVDLQLQSSSDIEGFPNLAKADEGNTIKINVRLEQLDEYAIKPGNTVCCEARKAFGQVYFLK